MIKQPITSLIILSLLILTACGRASSEPVVSSSPQSVATEAVESGTTVEAMAEVENTQDITETTETEPETAPQVETDWLTVEGKTDANLVYLGNPDAPVTMIDYSDFL